MRIAPPCHLLTATTPQNPTIHYKTLRYATKQSAYDTHFFLDILRVMCYRSVVIGEGYVTSQRLYDMKKELQKLHRQATIATIVSLGAWLLIILTLMLGS